MKKVEVQCIEDLVRVNLPLHIVQDIDKRIGDWLASGGSLDDPYIEQQFKYANNVLEARRRMNERYML